MLKFGEVVRARRKFLNLTLEALARKIGSHKGYVSGIENQKVSPPSPKITEKLSRALEINVDKLLLHGWAQKAPKKIRSWVSDMVSKELYER
jgi:transcriptional regulator with XRE-family HTH domain